MIFLYLFLGIVFVFVIGLFASYKIVVHNNQVENNTNLKIVQLSDTHFLNSFKLKSYNKMINKVNDSNPDIIIFTGDMFTTHDLDEDIITNVTEFFSAFECELKFAILGNHDYYGNASSIVPGILEEAGFTLLVNENTQVTINDTMYNIIGLDDLMQGDSDYTASLETSTEFDNNIVLSHEPDTFTVIYPYNIKYVFSGHSHGGQLRLPFIGDIYNVPGAKTYTEKQYHINDTYLFISFGLGESVVPFRLFNNRSIEIYEFS